MLLQCVSALVLCLQLTFAFDHRDIVTYLEDNNFTVIINDLNLVNLTDKLRYEKPFTVFVPTDAAFAALPQTLRNRLHNNLSELKHIILSHVISGGYIGPLILAGSVLTTLSGETLHFSQVPDGSITVNGVELLGSDIVVKNGVIHSIEKVLLPPTENIMQYLRSRRDELSIVESLLFLARLDKLLAGDGPFTVFLPNDQVFMDAKSQLLPIFANSTAVHELMTSHICNGTIYSTDLVDGQTLQTFGTQKHKVSQTSKGLQIGDAEVVRPNIPVTNGVLHIIDKTLNSTSI